MNIEFVDTKQYLDVEFENVQGISVGDSEDYYTGPYEVTPDVDGEILETGRKLMTRDVTINPIPYAEVSNNMGGKTVTIGGN